MLNNSIIFMYKILFSSATRLYLWVHKIMYLMRHKYIEILSYSITKVWKYFIYNTFIKFMIIKLELKIYLSVYKFPIYLKVHLIFPQWFPSKLYILHYCLSVITLLTLELTHAVLRFLFMDSDEDIIGANSVHKKACVLLNPQLYLE